MEINIPDLDDVEFEEACHICRWAAKGKSPDCSLCKGTGVRLSVVGQKLVAFLEKHYGLVPTKKEPE